MTLGLARRSAWRDHGRRSHTGAVDLDYRTLTRFLATARVAIGAALVVAPRRTGAGWAGPAADDGAVAALTRGLGIRDLVLGAGALRALDAGDPVRPWVLAGIVSDTVDAAAAVLALRSIGMRRTLPVMAVAAGAAAAGAAAAGRVDLPSDIVV